MKLILGDCIEKMKEIPDNSIDMVLTDPPYGTTACKWDSVIPFEPMWEQLNRVIKPNGAIVLFGSEPFSSALRMSNIKNYRYDWIWEKDNHTNFLNIKKQPAKRHELVSVFYKKQPTYNPQMWEGKENNNSSNRKNIKREYLGASFEDREVVKTTKKYPKANIFFKSMGRGKAVHPTQKPVALMEYLIRTYTNEGETVLDFTMGSGSTGVACVNTGRDFIGIELDEGYFNLANNRIKEAQSQGRLF